MLARGSPNRQDNTLRLSGWGDLCGSCEPFRGFARRRNPESEGIRREKQFVRLEKTRYNRKKVDNKERVGLQHIVLDFEMNLISGKNKEARALLRSEIIEIGAVKLDENYQIISQFDCYVKPQLDEIHKRVTQLTGITQQTVAKAPALREALNSFIGWIGAEPARIYAWSGSDRRQLQEECRVKGIYPDGLERPLKRWMDFQRIYTRLVGLSRRSPLSLKNAIGTAEQDFDGKQHSALDDALNTASLLQLVKDPAAFRERTQIVREAMKPKKAATTLGDLLGAALAQFKQEEDGRPAED